MIFVKRKWSDKKSILRVIGLGRHYDHHKKSSKGQRAKLTFQKNYIKPCFRSFFDLYFVTLYLSKTENVIDLCQRQTKKNLRHKSAKCLGLNHGSEETHVILAFKTKFRRAEIFCHSRHLFSSPNQLRFINFFSFETYHLCLKKR
jgi:hypothetical protein